MKTPDDFIHWLDDLFNALDLDNNINLMGISYGAWLTSQYALCHPERLNKIILIAPAATVQPLSLGWIFRASLCIIPTRYFTKNFMYWLPEDMSNKNETCRAMLEEEIDIGFLALKSFKFRRMVNPTVLNDSELQSIKVPALYIVGENEKVCSAAKAIQRLNTVAPHIKTEIIPNAGHDLTIVQAEMVNRIILKFFKQKRF